MLGTGHALVTNCYNTCFVIHEKNHYFLVDGGGGNGLLRQLQQAQIPWQEIHEIFVTHKHVDHILGILWMIRMICQGMYHKTYLGEVCIYGHGEVLSLLYQMASDLLLPREVAFIHHRVHLISVENDEHAVLCGCPVTFFDLHSPKTKQFGFSMEIPDGEQLSCCGDEPCTPPVYPYIEKSKWLLHEAFCLSAEAEIFHPHEKCHSTVKEACQTAQTLQVKNLILYHTEDTHLSRRKMLYLQEGQAYFSGKIWVPNDLERIQICEKASKSHTSAR